MIAPIHEHRWIEVSRIGRKVLSKCADCEFCKVATLGTLWHHWAIMLGSAAVLCYGIWRIVA